MLLIWTIYGTVSQQKDLSTPSRYTVWKVLPLVLRSGEKIFPRRIQYDLFPLSPEYPQHMTPLKEESPGARQEELFRPYYHRRCLLQTPSSQREGILHPDNGYVQFFYREGSAIRGLDFYPVDLVLREEQPLPRFSTTEDRTSFPVLGLDSLVFKYYLRRAGVDRKKG